MAKQKEARSKQEQGMLDSISRRDEPSPEPAAPSVTAPIGWMGYVGGVLWAMVFCAAGLVAWLLFASDR